MSKYDIECIENEIIEKLNAGKQVCIVSDCLNDCITSYSIRKYSYWKNVDTEEFKENFLYMYGSV